MATVISKDEADTHIRDLYVRALGGEEIEIAEAGKVKLRLVPVAGDTPPIGKRQAGTLKGMIREAPGVWNPMSDDELREIGLL